MCSTTGNADPAVATQAGNAAAPEWPRLRRWRRCSEGRHHGVAPDWTCVWGADVTAVLPTYHRCIGWPRPASGRVGACHRDRSTREQQIGHTEAEVAMGCPQAVVCVGLGRARVQTLGKMGVALLRARERGPEPGPRVLVPRVNPRLPLTCLPCYSRCRPHRRLAAG